MVGSWLAADGPNQYELRAAYDGVEEAAGLGWVLSDGLEAEAIVDTVDDVEVANATEEPPTVPNESIPTNETNPQAPPSGSSIQTGSTTGDSNITIKSSTNPSQNLTEGVFESQMGQLIKAVRSSGGNVSNVVNVDTDGIEDRIDTTNSTLDVMSTDLVGLLQGLMDNDDEKDAAEQALLDANPTAAEMDSAGSAAAANLEAVLPGQTPITVPTAAAGTRPNFAVTLPATMGGATFDLDPFRSDRLGTPIAWFRSAVAWLVLVTFGVWVFQETRLIVADIPKLPQAKGNAAVGGTGAQATALIAAAAITAIMASVVVGLVGWTFGDIGFSMILGLFTSNPTSSMPATAAWMLNEVFPVATMLTALIGRISFNAWAMKYYAIASSLIRFIVP